MFACAGVYRLADLPPSLNIMVHDSTHMAAFIFEVNNEFRFYYRCT